MRQNAAAQTNPISARAGESSTIRPRDVLRIATHPHLTRTRPSPCPAPWPLTLRLPLYNRHISPIRARLASFVAPQSSRPKTRGHIGRRPTSKRERPLLHVAHVAHDPLLSAPRSRPFHYKERAFLCIGSFRQPFVRFFISFALDFCSSFYTFLVYFSLMYVAASAAPPRLLSCT